MARKLFFVLLLCWLSASCQSTKPGQQLSVLITEQWLSENLPKEGPRLMMTEAKLQRAKALIQQDPLLDRYAQYLQGQANWVLQSPPLERVQVGKRLLSVSREALRRLTLLALTYRLTEEKVYLQRLDQELTTVCRFSDWNPSHFLDVAEMAMGVSLALDWTQEALPEKTVRLIKQTLKTKALEPSFTDDYFWISKDNNWNQVCHGGLIAAAIVLAEKEPSLAVQTLKRAVDNIPYGLEVYAPEGAYPEGPGYWLYGTAYSCLTFAIMQSALGTDFGFGNSEGFLESGMYKLMMATPSGQAYNYADNRTAGMNLENQQILLWFALQSEQSGYFDRERMISDLPLPVTAQDNGNRFSSAAFWWLADFVERQDEGGAESLPRARVWQGDNPIGVVRGKNGFYLGFKGGHASVNHGHADAGSFILQWRGVDWSLDPGNQSYDQVEQVMGNKLWDRDQESPRWTLLSKNNFGHTCLTVNDQLHDVDGMATIQAFREAADTSYALIEMSAVYGDLLDFGQRTIRQRNDSTVIITDEFETNSRTKKISWFLISTTNMRQEGEDIWLEKDGQQMKLSIESKVKPQIVIQSLDPPPLAYDIQIAGLKRLELIFPASAFADGKGHIRVRMAGQ